MVCAASRMTTRTFDREVTFDASRNRAGGDVGHQPGACFADRCPACPIRQARDRRDARQGDGRRAGLYGPQTSQKLTDVRIDRVFIGSCTNARIEDLRAAAAVLHGRSSKVPGLVSPGSSQVKQQAEQEGLDRISRAGRARMGGHPAARCALASMAIWCRPASDVRRAPIATSAAGRVRARARISCRRRWLPPRRSVGHLADARPLIAGSEECSAWRNSRA